MHHEYKLTIAGTVFYVHPLDQLLTFIFPLAIATITMRNHISTTWISLMSMGLSSIIIHSGYHLPFLSSPEFHDYHHVK